MYNITVFITRIVWATYVELYNCEELVEVTHRGRWVWFYKVSFLKELGKQGLR